jgi:hypothetical protein
MVARLTPSSRAIEETVLSGRISRSRAWRTCSAVMAVMTQRPDLAAVALPMVGVMDMLRFQEPPRYAEALERLGQ